MKKLVIAALLAAGIVGVSAQGWDPSMGNTSMNLVSQTGYVTYGESAALVDPALVGTRIGSDFTGVIYYNDAVVATCNFGSVEKNGEIVNTGRLAGGVVYTDLVPANADVELVVGAYNSWVDGATTEAEGAAGATFMGKSNPFEYATGDQASAPPTPCGDLMNFDQFTVEYIPEPTTIALGILGLGGLFLLRRRS